MEKNKIPFLKRIIKDKKTWIILCLVLVICGYFIFRSRKVTYQFISVTKGPITESVSLTGNTTPEQSVSLTFGSSGIVSHTYSSLGKKVSSGQVLAELNTNDLLSQLHNAQAGLIIARQHASASKNNLASVKSQQDVLVKNAYYNLLNSTPEAIPKDGTGDYVAPIISGNYNLGKEGTIKLTSYYSAGGSSFSATGLTEGTGAANSITSQPIGDSGLFIKFPSTTNININDWIIEIPNKKAANYLQNYNAYQAALKGQAQAVSLATSDLDQARATLNAKQAAARPEDVAIAKAQVDSAQGALEIAQTAYNNNFIYAQADGVITVVNAKVGEISIMNQKAIGMTVKLNTNK